MVQLVYKGDEGDDSHSWVPKDSEEIAPYRAKIAIQEEIDNEIAKEEEDIKSPEDAVEHQNSDNDTEPDQDEVDLKLKEAAFNNPGGDTYDDS